MKRIYFILFFLSFISTLFSQTKDENDFYQLDKAREHIKSGAIEKGLKFIDSILQINPSNPYAWELKGSLYANEFNDYYKAIINYKKFEAIFPDEALNLANIGKNYFKLDSIEQGKKYILRAFEIDPYNEYIIVQYAYNISKSVSEKVKLYQNALIVSKLKLEQGKQPTKSVMRDIYNNLGYNLYVNQQFMESTVSLLEGLKYVEESDEYFNNLGNSLQRLNYLQNALDYYDKALQIEPKKVFSLNGKANTFQKLQQIDSACIYWKKAIDNGYVFKEEWREIWNIEDPKLLLSKYCSD
ncbi:MAG: tetratricopeptide repeat protein [Allomuricauda sp.]|nr:MAG: tetratricopeptide repeat protein [Allomuricauda sp.]